MNKELHPLKVLVVEDIKLIRQHLIVALEEFACAAVVAEFETEGDAVAWAQTTTCEWDLAVIDLLLKSGSGLGVLRALEQRGPSRRAVVLTNYATDSVRERCLAQGADRVFDKSLEIDAFLEFCAAAHALRHADRDPVR